MIVITNEQKGAFHEALREAKPGEPIVYHIGEHCGGVHRRDVMEAYEQGLVAPVQSRDGPGRFIYIAVKLQPREKK